MRAKAFSVAVVALFAAGCSSSSGTTVASGPAPRMDLSTRAPSPDPRVGLAAGTMVCVTAPTQETCPTGQPNRRTVGQPAAEASWNMRLITNVPSPGGFAGVTNSDLGFIGNYVVQGNYNGVQFWDVSTPTQPKLAAGYLCPASQSDVSVFRNLLFVSGESVSGRIDCGSNAPTDSVSHDRLRGIRIFDVTDVKNPKYIANVQTCRGSHTHTLVHDPRDPNNIYIYVSGSSGVRSPTELPGCSSLAPDQDPNSSRFRIEVIQVPLAAPQTARIIASPRIFQGLAPAPLNAPRTAAENPGAPPPAPAAPAANRTGPEQCHDITVYPEIGLAGGACAGYGLLLDISDVKNPKRLFAAADSNFAYWHSATFSNDGTKVLFTDEWGGGGAPRCRSTDKPEWGADAIFRIEGQRLTMQSYYKLPAAQTTLENCVAHNGSLIPIPGRDIMAQSWYQGGVSIFEWTDPAHPVEIAFFDRGPLNGSAFASGGTWSVYWWNGYLYSSEIVRGLDVFELQPSGFLTQNEIDAAKTVRFDYWNTQQQRKIVWPPSFPLAKAYLDQLERNSGIAGDRLRTVRAEVARIEGLGNANQRRDALTTLAGQLDQDVSRSADQAKVRLLATAVRDLAAAQR